MKLKFVLAALLAGAASMALAGGVASITKADVTSNGHQAYKIVCSNGNDYRIWWADGQWYDGWGAQGGQNRNLEEQAELLCN